MSNFAERLTAFKESRGYTYREMDDLTGVSHSYLRKLCHGEKPTREHMVVKLAKGLKTTVAWLQNGDPRVNIWPDFQLSKYITRVADPGTPVAQRVESVLFYLQEHYGGHMQTPDIARYIGIDVSVLHRVIAGEEPSPYLVKELSNLCGVPVAWFELGAYAPLSALGPVAELPPDELHQLLLLGLKARERGVPLTALHTIIDTMAKGRG